MSALEHTIIRASAGTGKTHQLAARYLALLVLEAAGKGAAPEKMAAITFTRKGAGEFADRILSRLAEAARAGNETERTKLESDLRELVQGNEAKGTRGLAPGAPMAADTEALRAVLGALVDELDRLTLGTIDGFMARSVQTLAFELGIDRFEIVETPAAARARRELIGAILREASREGLGVFHDTLKGALLKSSSGYQDAMEDLIRGSHELLHSLPWEEAWGGARFWDVAAPAPAGEANDWRAAALALAREAEVLDFGHKSIGKSLAGALAWLATRNPGAPGCEPPGWLKDGGQLQRFWFASPEGAWEFEYQKKTRRLPAAVVCRLKGILGGWLAAERSAYASRTKALHAILSRYETYYSRMLRRRGRLMFSDLPILLRGGEGSRLAEESLQALGFRWFVRLDHWLLDEFQDTSRTQWAVLKPWLDEALQDDSGEKSVFVVGDPKQSIYGWRGGEPRLFQDLCEEYGGRFSQQVMAQSWRSRPAVLELVNRICSPERNAALRDPDSFPSAMLPRWIYDIHEPAQDRAKEPGYAAVVLTAEPEGTNGNGADGEGADVTKGASLENGEDDEGKKLGARARAIQSVLREVRPLERGLSCAILVRANRHGQVIARWLREHGEPNVMVEGDVRLSDESPLVAAIVDALRWLQFPAYELGVGHVRLTPLWEALSGPLRGAMESVGESTVWEHWRRRVAETGAGEVTREWCAALSAKVEGEYNQQCLRQVDQLAARLTQGLSLAEWVESVKELTIRETAAPGSVHVLTIHKAKGLGYDVVFLADLDLGRRHPETMLLRRGEDGAAEGCLLCPPKVLRGWMPDLRQVCDAQEAQDDLEALCVLYVALTRAREAAFVVLDEEKPQTASRAREWILGGVPEARQAAGSAELSPWPGGRLGWETGSRSFFETARPTPDQPGGMGGIVTLPAPVPRRQRRTPSTASHRERPASVAAVSWGDTAEEFGLAMHAVLEQIEWWDPAQKLRGDARVVEQTRQCVRAPGVTELFEPTGPDEAWREIPVDLLEPEAVWSGVVDRLVVRRRPDGRITKAIVVDFKTDRVDQAHTLEGRHREQMRVYRKAVAQALHLEAALVESVLVSTHLRQMIVCA